MFVAIYALMFVQNAKIFSFTFQEEKSSLKLYNITERALKQKLHYIQEQFCNFVKI